MYPRTMDRSITTSMASLYCKVMENRNYLLVTHVVSEFFFADIFDYQNLVYMAYGEKKGDFAPAYFCGF